MGVRRARVVLPPYDIKPPSIILMTGRPIRSFGKEPIPLLATDDPGDMAEAGDDPLWVKALEIVEDCVVFAAACLLLPEYWLSTAARRRSGCPPHIAYEYGDAIAGLCRILHIALHRAVHGLTIAAQEVPPPFVAVLTGGIYLAARLQ